MSQVRQSSRIRKAPKITPYNDKFRDYIRIFLAGSIEMGTAEDWQEYVTQRILESTKNTLIMNPRRDNWDSTLEQSIHNREFLKQVNWEQTELKRADYVFFYFQPGTQSPITLLELGQMLSDDERQLIVCCPNGFWRKGNVDIVCKDHGVEVLENIESAVHRLINGIKEDFEF